VVKLFSRGNRFITISCLVVYPTVGILVHLAVTGVVSEALSASLCLLVGLTPILVLLGTFALTKKVL